MPLICECGFDFDESVVGDCYRYYTGSSDYKSPPEGRRKRCSSCGELINHDELTIEHYRARTTKSEIESRIHGEEGEIPIGSHYTCEKCSDIFLSLSELGYCVLACEHMETVLSDYHTRLADSLRGATTNE